MIDETKPDPTQSSADTQGQGHTDEHGSDSPITSSAVSTHVHDRTYQVQIDKDLYRTYDPNPTGSDLLKLANKLSTEHALYSKLPGEQPKRIQPEEHVDLTQPGVERFVTLPLDQTEGLGAGRRDFSLPEEDMDDRETWRLCHSLKDTIEGCDRKNMEDFTTQLFNLTKTTTTTHGNHNGANQTEGTMHT